MVRASDLCCRYGGEEFAWLRGASDLVVVARRVRELLARFSTHAVMWPYSTPVYCSLSAGISASTHEEQAL